MSLNTYKHTELFTFENGQEIQNLEIAYHTYGELNSDKSNVIWVCHALTANSDVLDWWPGLFGEYDLFNPKGQEGNVSSRLQWQQISSAFGKLDHKVPYFLATGNHDYGFKSAEYRSTH